MALFRPIPKKYLTDSIIYFPPYDVGDGSMGGGSQAQSVVIENVRFTDERAKMIKGTTNENFIMGKIYIDKLNSSPFTEIDERGTIVFEGKKLKIVSVNTLKTIVGEGIHHLEIEVE